MKFRYISLDQRREHYSGPISPRVSLPVEQAYPSSVNLF